MSALHKRPPTPAAEADLSWAQYLRRSRESPVKLEYVNGRVYAMAGASGNHNRIAGNVFGELHRALKGKPCEAFVSDMLLKIALGEDELGYYPDVMVVCDPADRDPGHRTSPKVIFEVLSHSTSRLDRREKLLAYQALPSMEVYVILEQTSMRATIHRRANHWWPEIVEGEGAVITLDELGLRLPLQDVYDRVDWATPEPQA